MHWAPGAKIGIAKSRQSKEGLTFGTEHSQIFWYQVSTRGQKDNLTDRSDHTQHTHNTMKQPAGRGKQVWSKRRKPQSEGVGSSNAGVGWRWGPGFLFRILIRLFCLWCTKFLSLPEWRGRGEKKPIGSVKLFTFFFRVIVLIKIEIWNEKRRGFWTCGSGSEVGGTPESPWETGFIFVFGRIFLPAILVLDWSQGRSGGTRQAKKGRNQSSSRRIRDNRKRSSGSGEESGILSGSPLHSQSSFSLFQLNSNLYFQPFSFRLP